MLKWIRLVFSRVRLSAIRLLRAREEILDLTAKLEVERHRIRKLEAEVTTGWRAQEIMGDDGWVGAMNISAWNWHKEPAGWSQIPCWFDNPHLSYPAAMYPYWILLGTRGSWKSQNPKSWVSTHRKSVCFCGIHAKGCLFGCIWSFNKLIQMNLEGRVISFIFHIDFYRIFHVCKVA